MTVLKDFLGFTPSASLMLGILFFIFTISLHDEMSKLSPVYSFKQKMIFLFLIASYSLGILSFDMIILTVLSDSVCYITMILYALVPVSLVFLSKSKHPHILNVFKFANTLLSNGLFFILFMVFSSMFLGFVHAQYVSSLLNSDNGSFLMSDILLLFASLLCLIFMNGKLSSIASMSDSNIKFYFADKFTVNNSKDITGCLLSEKNSILKIKYKDNNINKIIAIKSQYISHYEYVEK